MFPEDTNILKVERIVESYKIESYKYQIFYALAFTHHF